MLVEQPWFDTVALVILIVGFVWLIQFIVTIFDTESLYSGKISWDDWLKLQYIPFYFLKFLFKKDEDKRDK